MGISLLTMQKLFHLTEKCEHEDAVISYPQLVGIFKVISGDEVILLHQQQQM